MLLIVTGKNIKRNFGVENSMSSSNREEILPMVRMFSIILVILFFNKHQYNHLYRHKRINRVITSLFSVISFDVTNWPISKWFLGTSRVRKSTPGTYEKDDLNGLIFAYSGNCFTNRTLNGTLNLCYLYSKFIFHDPYFAFKLWYILSASPL